MAPPSSPIYGFEMGVWHAFLILCALVLAVIVAWVLIWWLARRAAVRREIRFEIARQRLANEAADDMQRRRELARQQWLDTYIDYGLLPQSQVTAYYLSDREFDQDAHRMIPTGYTPRGSGRWEPIGDGEQLRVVYQLDPRQFHEAAQRWSRLRGTTRVLNTV